jgi:hypothetical protein
MSPLENIAPNAATTTSPTNRTNNNSDPQRELKERIVFLENQVKSLQTIIKAQNSRFADHDKRIQILDSLLRGQAFQAFPKVK